MRAARLIKMVLLLQSRPMMTAAELARELAVSERTVTRDAQALSEAGVPVYAERGRAGGYRLVGGYRTGLTGLARTEAEALFLSGLPGALREMGLDDAASAARLKVSAALLPSLRNASANAAQRFHLDAPGWYQEPSTPDALPAVARAVWDDRIVEARYGRADRVVERRLEPYGLVLKGGIWYVCARAEPGDLRVYRLDRFTAVTVSDQHFARAEDFDLPAFWESRAADFARTLLRTEAVLRLSAIGVRTLPRVLDPAGAREALAKAPPPDGSGRVTVTVPVESVEVAYVQLLGLGAEVEVVSPAELRELLARTAEGLSRLYATAPSAGEDSDPPGEESSSSLG